MESSNQSEEIIYYGHPDFVFLDDEERELIESIENDDGWRPVENQEAAKAYFQEVARRTMEKRGIPESGVSDRADAAPPTKHTPQYRRTEP